MSVKVFGKVTGIEKLEKGLNRFKAEVLSKSVEATRDVTFLIHRTAIELVQDNSSGNPQVRYTNGRKRTVLASRPGDPPNTDTGRLVQSIKFDFKNGGLIGRVGTNLRYGAWLEFGTQHMAPRPWLSTAIEMNKDEVTKIFEKAFRKATKESGK